MTKYVKKLAVKWKGRCEKVGRMVRNRGKREVVQAVTTGKECIMMKMKRSK